MRSLKSVAACAQVVFLVASITAPSAFAQEDSTPVFELGDVTIVGRKVAGMDRAGANSPTAASPAVDAAAVLSSLPGVELQNVGARSETQVMVRGFDSRQVTLYLDGVPVYVPYDGNVDLARFSNEELAMVSVEKGASSLAYGPNALGGAINLVTRVPVREWELGAHLGMRGLDGGRGGLRLGFRKESWYAIATASGRGSEGWNLPDRWSRTVAEDGQRRWNSATRDRTLHGKVGWTGENGAQAALAYTDQHGEKGTPVYAGRDPAATRLRYWDWPYWDRRSLHQVSQLPVLPWLSLGTSLYYDAFANSLDSYDDSTLVSQKKKSSFRSAYDDRTFGGSGSARLTWRRDTLKLFVHLKDDLHSEENTSNDTAKARDKVAFVQKPDTEFRDRTVTGGLEASVAMPFGFSFAPGASWSRREALQADNLKEPKAYQYEVESFPLESQDAFDAQGVFRWAVGGRHQVKVAVSSRTRFPTIKDRYSYRLGSAIPNPGLGPERSLQTEIAYAGSPVRGVTIQAGFWEAWLEDALQTVTKVGSAGESQMQNTGNARFEGPRWLGNDAPTWTRLAPELTVRLDAPWRGVGLEKASLSTTYTFLRRRNLDHPEIEFIDLPEHSLKVAALWTPVPPIDLLWNTTGSSSRPSSSDGKWHATGFTVHDAGLRVRIGHAAIQAGLKNVFDEVWALSEGYPEEGRVGTLDVSVEL